MRTSAASRTRTSRRATSSGRARPRGRRWRTDSVVTIQVSSGKPEVTIPDVVGQSRDSAVAELTQAGLTAQVVEVNSDREEGTVTAQSPQREHGRRGRDTGADQRLEGPAAGHGPERRRTCRTSGPRRSSSRPASTSPASTWAPTSRRASSSARIPSAGTETSRGATVTLSVSRGPSTVAVPDVVTQDAADRARDARAGRLPGAGADRGHGRPGLGGHRHRAGSRQAGRRRSPGSVVTIFVGRFTAARPSRPRRSPPSRRSEAPHPRRGHRGRPFERARDLDCVGALGGRGARSGPVRDDRDRDRPRRALGARRCERRAPRSVRLGRAWKRFPSWPIPPPPRPWGRSTSRSRSCTAPSARTGPSRGSSSSPGSRTSARESRRPRSAWTRTSSRPCCGTAASRWRGTSRSATEIRPTIRSRTRCS